MYLHFSGEYAKIQLTHAGRRYWIVNFCVNCCLSFPYFVIVSTVRRFHHLVGAASVFWLIITPCNPCSLRIKLGACILFNLFSVCFLWISLGSRYEFVPNPQTKCWSLLGVFEEKGIGSWRTSSFDMLNFKYDNLHILSNSASLNIGSYPVPGYTSDMKKRFVARPSMSHRSDMRNLFSCFEFHSQRCPQKEPQLPFPKVTTNGSPVLEQATVSKPAKRHPYCQVVNHNSICLSFPTYMDLLFHHEALRRAS